MLEPEASTIKSNSEGHAPSRSMKVCPMVSKSAHLCTGWQSAPSLAPPSPAASQKSSTLEATKKYLHPTEQKCSPPRRCIMRGKILLTLVKWSIPGSILTRNGFVVHLYHKSCQCDSILQHPSLLWVMPWSISIMGYAIVHLFHDRGCCHPSLPWSWDLLTLSWAIGSTLSWVSNSSSRDF